MVIESPTTKYFSAAIQQILAQSGHGSQADLARRARVSASYLNDLLSGRKPYWPDPVKERVAAVAGYSVAELLDIGEHFIKDRVFWPHGRKVAGTASKSPDRIALIYQLAAHDAGLHGGHILFTAATLPMMFPTAMTEFAAGTMSDAKAYADAVAFCRSILARACD